MANKKLFLELSKLVEGEAKINYFDRENYDGCLCNHAEVTFESVFDSLAFLNLAREYCHSNGHDDMHMTGDWHTSWYWFTE